MALPDSGTLALGDSCELDFDISSGASARLEVTRGMDSGKVAFVGHGPFALGELCRNAPPLAVSFSNGRPLAQSATGEMLLNGARVIGAVQLIRGDTIEVDRKRVEVTG
jgi:hypothetical protein